MKYSDKLRDPRWQKKRLEVMERDSFTCLACGDKTTTLNVHHKYYSGNPWESDMDGLETLCETCHGKRSELNKRFLALPSKLAFLIELPNTERIQGKSIDELIEIEEMWLRKNLRNANNDTVRSLHCERLMQLQSERDIKIDGANDGQWNDDLMCNVINIEYKDATVNIYLPPSDAADGRGAKLIAERLIPGCERINIYNAGVLNHSFRRPVSEMPWALVEARKK